MRLKTYIAKSMSEAMRQVTKELGADAVIVSNRKTPEGMVKITAALDTIKVEENWLNEEENQKPKKIIKSKTAENEFLDIITSTLLRHNTPAEVTDKIISQLEQSRSKDVLCAFADALDGAFKFNSFSAQKTWKKPLMVVGIPGTGKTLTVAKLAAQAVISGSSPIVITADTVRAGALEQLNAFTRVLELDLYTVSNLDDLLGVLVKHNDASHIIIDSPGVNPFIPAEMKMLASYIKAKDMDVVLALSGGTDAEESSEIARAFKIIGARYLIPTRLDMSRRLGGVLAAADNADLCFMGCGCAPSVADGLMDLTALDLARFLLPKKYYDND